MTKIPTFTYKKLKMFRNDNVQILDDVPPYPIYTDRIYDYYEIKE
jgi:hypothetical protein